MRPPGVPRTGGRWRAWLLALPLGVGAAQGAPPRTPELPEGETAGAYVYGGALYDSNLLRFSSDAEAEERLGDSARSDWVSRVGTGALVEWPVSLQALRFQGWLERNRYQRFDELDHTAGDALAAWDWEAGRRWSGTLDAGYARGIARFEELQALEREVRTGGRASADAGFRFLPDWRAVAGARHAQTRYEQRGFLDRRETLTFAELWYEPTATRSRFGLQVQRTDGDLERRQRLPDGSRVSNDFRQEDAGLLLGWSGSGKSYLEGWIGYTERRHDERPARDFNGVTGRLTYLWEASVKTSVRLSAWRELQSLDDEIATYVLSHGASVEPIWEATPKVRLRGRLSAANRSFEGAEGTSSADTGREDDVYAVALGLDYELLRSLYLTVELQHEARDSSVERSDYDYRQLFAGFSYVFH